MSPSSPPPFPPLPPYHTLLNLFQVSSSSPHAENPAAPGDIAADVAASSTAKALTLRDPSAAKAASGDPEAPARARTDFVAAYAASELSLAASKAVAANLAAAPPGAAAPRPPVTASAGAKFSALLSRMLLFHWRNTGWTNVKLYVYLFLALLFGLMYLGISDSDLSGILSKTAVALNGIAFMGIVTFNTGLTNWGDYRRVFYREKAAGYYPAPLYALSVYLAEVPSVAFNTLAYTAINYFMVGFSSNAGAFFTAYLATFLGTLWYTSLGMLFIGWLPITLLAQILGGPTTQITLLFAGVNLPKRDLPEAWKFLYEADGMAEALRLFMLPQYPTCTTPGCPTVAVGAAQLAGYSGPVLASNGAGYVVYKNDWAASRLDMTYDNRWNSLGYLVALQAGALVLIIFVYTRINHQSR